MMLFSKTCTRSFWPFLLSLSLSLTCPTTDKPNYICEIVIPCIIGNGADPGPSKILFICAVPIPSNIF